MQNNLKVTFENFDLRMGIIVRVRVCTYARSKFTIQPDYRGEF